MRRLPYCSTCFYNHDQQGGWGHHLAKDGTSFTAAKDTRSNGHYEEDKGAPATFLKSLGGASRRLISPGSREDVRDI